MSPKILIAYYSLTNNTKQVAEAIHAHTGGDLFAIEMEHPYPKVYSEVLKASRPDYQNKVRPPLKSKVENMAEYDIVFVGSPNWFGTFAPPVFSFLEKYDFSGKMVIPFMTHGGGGISKSMREITEVLPESTLLEGFAISHRELMHADERVVAWLKKLNLAQ